MDEFMTKYGVAIIGMSGRFPGANSIEGFWDNLCQGKETITLFSDAELAEAGIPEKVRTDPRYVPAKGILDDIAGFDASFFNISPQEAELIDPQQRIFLECAWEALERGGYDPETYAGRIGVYASCSKNTYLMLNLLSHPQIREPSKAIQTLVANEKDYISTRTSYKLNLRGPSVTVQTACSSSLVALHLACQSLLSGECDMALVGGASIDVPHKSGYTYLPEGIFSPDGHCRVFDARARGTVFSQGVGVVLLKRLARALEEKDWIHAVIRGSAVNNDGSGKVGFTAPSVEGQAAVITDALAAANVTADSISYVEAHGTGTVLGDPVEVEALTKAFRTDRRRACALGSVKSNVGHLNAASGIAGIIKTALALERKELPPSLHFEVPNPRIDFESSPFYVCRGEKWHPDGRVRRAGVSSLGIGGTNAHVILEEATPTPSEAHRGDEWHLIPLSARTVSALEATTDRLVQYLVRNPEVSLGDAAFTLQIGRRSFQYRRTVLCRSVKQLVDVLSSRGSTMVQSAVVEGPARRLTFLFPDRAGPVRSAMSRLCPDGTVYQDELASCCELVLRLTGADLRGASSGSSEACGAEGRLALEEDAAQFAVEYALARQLMAWGVEPGALFGVGVGEYVAACLSGALSLEEALSRASSVARSAPCDGRRMAEALRTTLADSHAVLLEVGPGESLCQLAALHECRGAGHALIATLPRGLPRDAGGRALIASLGQLWLAGVQPNWGRVPSPERRRRIPLPTYPFERKSYWIGPRNELTVAAVADPPGDASQRQDGRELYARPELPTAFVEPRNVWEREIAEVFKRILRVDRVGALDDFFDLGGDSLRGTELVQLVRERLGVAVELDALFGSPSVEAMAAAARSAQGGATWSSSGRSPSNEADLELEANITPLEPYRFEEDPSAVLVTGSTGFLGTFVVQELLRRTGSTVYCVVRAPTASEALARVRKSLSAYGLGHPDALQRIRAVSGDLSRPRFGLADGEYEKLSREVSMVYHIGARLSFVEPYHTLRNINVRGTRSVLRFACEGRAKHVHHVSSIAAFDSETFARVDVVNDDQPLDRSRGFHSGYDETKWVSEMIVAEARRRGVPVTVYRPGNITGDSKTGAFSPNDLIGRMLRGCVELGYAPDDTAFVDVEPIDYVSRALVHLSLSPASAGKTYHLVNPHHVRWLDLVQMMRTVGYDVQAEPFAAWRERLRRASRAGDKNPLLPLLPMFDARPLFSGRRYGCSNALLGLQGTDIGCRPMDVHLFGLYVRHLVNSGVLKKVG